MNRREWLVVSLVVLVVTAALGLGLSRGALYSSQYWTRQYPLRVAYVDGLRVGSLSLWTPQIAAGYPLLAQGSAAALYPPNLILSALLPASTAVNVLVLLHLVWAAVGAYWLARRLGARTIPAAVLALASGLAWFLTTPVSDVNRLFVAVWLPWLLLLMERLLAGRSSAATLRYAALLAIALGMALLVGQTVIALVGMAAVAVLGLILGLTRRTGMAAMLQLMLALGLGVALALPQLLPAQELAGQTVSPAGETPAASPDGAPLAAAPRALDFLHSQTGIYRIYSQEQPGATWLARRESLSGMLPLAYGLPSANSSEMPMLRWYARFSDQIAPNQLNLLGVKHYLIPQPHGEGGQDYDLNNPFVYNPMDSVSPTPIVMSHIVEIEWYISDSADLINGEPVALLTIIPEEMDEALDFNLTVGSHVADWAYDRSDVKTVVRHSQARVARSFPARSGNPPEDHTGYVYKAKITLPYGTLTQGLWFLSRIDPARIHIERVVMTDETGTQHVLAELAGKSDHVLVYRTEDVAIFENYDVLPRAFLAYAARAVPNDDEALTLLQAKEFDPRREVLLASAEVQPVAPPTEGAESINIRSYAAEKVTLDVTAPAAGYLVLTDAWYPGWQVRVDGTAAPLERANVMFRAVYVEPGQHTVEFAYQPSPFRTGLIAATVALLAALVLIVLGASQRKRPSATLP